MTVDDFTNLRDRLVSSGKAAESMVQDLEEHRKTGLLGHISTAVHASVIEQYRQDASQLLSIVPGDAVAINALKHADDLVSRISKTDRSSQQG